MHGALSMLLVARLALAQTSAQLLPEPPLTSAQPDVVAVTEETPEKPADTGVGKLWLGGIFGSLAPLAGVLAVYTSMALAPALGRSCSGGFVGEGVLFCGAPYVGVALPWILTAGLAATATVMFIIGGIRRARWLDAQR